MGKAILSVQQVQLRGGVQQAADEPRAKQKDKWWVYLVKVGTGADPARKAHQYVYVCQCVFAWDKSKVMYLRLHICYADIKNN